MRDNRQRLMILFLAVAVLLFVAMSCDNLDMDRAGPAWTATTPTVSTEYVPDVQVPGGWK